MLNNTLFKAIILGVFLSTVFAHPRPGLGIIAASETVAEEGTHLAVRRVGRAPIIPTHPANVDGKTISTNTTVQAAAVPVPAAVVAATSVKSTILVIARDTASAYSGFSGLNGYGIPYQVLVVPQAGVALPVLNSSVSIGNFGAIVVLSEVSYDYGGTTGFQSALTAAQWATLYQYQVSFGVRMVRLDVFPGPDFGATALGGCCNDGVEQLVSISNTAAFPTSGIKTGAGVTTAGLWHYPASITNASIATEFAQFAANSGAGFSSVSTAGVINNIGGRQQMAFFIGFATDWSYTSTFLQHAWITWATRGLYTGYRRINLNTQVDDMFLESDIYSPAGTTYRITPADLTQHVTWQANVNSRMSAGSSWFLEIGHNGNGNIEASDDIAIGTQCGTGPIEYPEQIDTPLEWVKPIGTGTNLWPATPSTYPYTTTCTNIDSLKTWFANTGNLNAFAHLSHTFTHEDENNATYFDVSREISWNQAWLKQVGIAAATKFSPKGIIPPAITGLHNGDALRAWKDNGIVNVVGDNTRPVLMNQVNEMWPLISTVAANGYAGIQINPRWATNIYYNCQLPACTVLEWINTSAGSGDWTALLALEKATNSRHLLGLHHDAFMFHQANLNYVTAGQTTINGVAAKLSLIQAWVETVFQEVTRLVNWPIISQKHDDFATGFANRMARDGCNPTLTYVTSPSTKKITGVTVTTTGNTCSAPIPVTVPGTVTNTQGFTTEKIGGDPLTIWVKMTGTPVTFTLSSAIPF
ncbi:hypothetical protein B7463_g9237, partial [Scytalidium lignicola]